jgi:hypothetical protein
MAKSTTTTRTRTAAKPVKVITPTGNMADHLKRWQAKAAGAKPTTETINMAATVGGLKRTGTSKHLALAMYLRATGATQPETVAGTGDTQINAYYEAVRGGQFVPVTLPARNGHKVYALALPKPKAKRASKAKAKADKAAPVAAAPETSA